MIMCIIAIQLYYYSCTEAAGHASEWSGGGGPSVARGTNCGDAKYRRWSPWTTCDSRGPEGPSMAAALGPGGPLVV